MSGPVIFVWTMLAAFAASIILGVVTTRRCISLLLSLLLGVVTALLRIRYDPGPAALPGLVGYPLMCMGLNRLGAFIRRIIRRRRDKVTGVKGTNVSSP